jgi:hypothetical protein
MRQMKRDTCSRNVWLAIAQKRRAAARTREELVERIEREAPDLRELAGRAFDEAIKKPDERKAEAAVSAAMQ